MGPRRGTVGPPRHRSRARQPAQKSEEPSPRGPHETSSSPLVLTASRWWQWRERHPPGWLVPGRPRSAEPTWLEELPVPRHSPASGLPSAAHQGESPRPLARPRSYTESTPLWRSAGPTQDARTVTEVGTNTRFVHVALLEQWPRAKPEAATREDEHHGQAPAAPPALGGGRGAAGSTPATALCALGAAWHVQGFGGHLASGVGPGRAQASGESAPTAKWLWEFNGSSHHSAHPCGSAGCPQTWSSGSGSRRSSPPHSNRTCWGRSHRSQTCSRRKGWHKIAAGFLPGPRACPPLHRAHGPQTLRDHKPG